MKAILLAIAVVSSILIATSLYESSNSTSLYDEDVNTLFTKWCMKNGKSYGNQSDRQYRLGVFAQNLAKVQAHSQKTEATYSLGLNKFADLTSAEFNAQYLGFKPQGKKAKNYDNTYVNAPASKDWSTTDAVTGVKDQGRCGSCWAFSTTGSIEGLYYLQNGTQRSFSEQQLMDCSGNYGNMSCNGGLMDNAFQYVETQGLTDESNYPYTARDAYSCNSSAITNGFKISSYVDVANSQTALVNAIAQRPVSIAINANPIQLYTSGIFNDWSCGDQLDHGVLAVGYGTENGQDFFKVKNSWGTYFGENGYFRLARKSSGEGICGCTAAASYPTA